MKKLDIFFLSKTALHPETLAWLGLAVSVSWASFHLGEDAPDLKLFARSGALVTLIGAFATYRDFKGYLSRIVHELADESSANSDFNNIFENQEKILKRSRMAEISLVIFGTLISAYGDFLA